MSIETVSDRWLILWLVVDEWEIFRGTLDDAQRHVNGDRRWHNYGRRGAVILPLVEPVYEIRPDVTHVGWLQEVA